MPKFSFHPKMMGPPIIFPFVKQSSVRRYLGLLMSTEFNVQTAGGSISSLQSTEYSGSPAQVRIGPCQSSTTSIQVSTFGNKFYTWLGTTGMFVTAIYIYIWCSPRLQARVLRTLWKRCASGEGESLDFFVFLSKENL